jgi:hypothetical protein
MTKHQLALPDSSCFTPILERIREETSKILKIPFERFFTDHSVEGHSTRILQHLHGLTHGLKAPLCEDEEYILIAATYLHDISLAWKNEMDFLELRKNHPRLSGELIRGIANGEQIRGIQCEFGLPHRSSQYAIHTEFIARVVEGHGGTTADGKYADTVLSTSKVRVRFLADLLAFADELDLHRARVDLTRLAQAKMPEADIFHWWKHWFIIGVRVEQLGIVQVSYAFPEDMRTNNECPDLVQTYVKLRLQNEYAKVESTLAPEGVNLHPPPPHRSFTPLALPGEERPSQGILALFRNAVTSYLPTARTMLEPNEVSGNIEFATQYFMDGMLPAVVGEKLYVRRRDSEEAFEEFVEHASERLFLLAGRPGTGKTMFIRRMISKYPSFSLYYRYSGGNCSIEDLPHYIVEQYASTIAGKLQAKKYRELDLRKLEDIAKSKGKWIIIFIESNLSLNDLTNSQNLLLRLLTAISGRNTKICLTCVADVGETLHVPDDVAKMVYRPASRMGIVAPSSVLEDYSEEEFAHACIRYFDERKIKASEADFVDEARDRLKNPLWLDIYSMARADYQRTGIETSIRYVEVCESFLTNRSAKAASILGLAEGTRLIQRCLNKMAEEIISPHRVMLGRSTVMESIATVFGTPTERADSILEAMKMAGLIKESYYGDPREGYIRFAFDEIREYLVARQSAIHRLGWDSDATTDDVRGRFAEVLRIAAGSVVPPYGVGVLEFLILLLEHAARDQKPIVLNLPHIDIAVVSQLLGDLAESRIELGQRVCARVLGRLEECPEDLRRLIEELSTNEHESVRRDLTYSLSALSRDTQGVAPRARKILSQLTDDPSESVASCAVAALIRSFEKEAVPLEWVNRFMTIGQSHRRGLVTTMMREFSRRTFPNIRVFFPDILKHLCLRKESDYQIVAAACDCLARNWHLFGEEALFIVRGVIENFRHSQHDEVVMRQAIPALIAMEPCFQKDVYRLLEDVAKLKRNETLKCEIVRNYRKLSSDNRENLLRILEKDESSIVRALVYTARNA